MMCSLPMAGVLLHPVGWETHSSPDLSAPAQELINDRVLKDCGSVEEIELPSTSLLATATWKVAAIA
jgi:hypothetical protein